MQEFLNARISVFSIVADRVTQLTFEMDSFTPEMVPMHRLDQEIGYLF
jgi:hypothetical protein